MKTAPLPIPQKAISTKKISKKVATTAVKKATLLKNDITRPEKFTVVAIGASAGGLEAITQLLQSLSPTTGMAFIYVQHLSPDHKSILSELLSKTTKMKVQDIEDMEKMEPNNVYVIPYNKAIEVTDGHIKLLPRPSKSYILSIDILFSSLAETHKENVIGIVLSGSAGDGTQGLKEIKSAGGITFAQDDSAKYSSMPKSAIAAGVVDFILPPKEIGKKINWMSKHPLIRRNGVKHIAEDEIDNNKYLRYNLMCYVTALFKTEGKDNVRKKAELIFLLMDMLTCPYLDDQTKTNKDDKYRYKKKLLSLSGVDSANHIGIIEKENFWFTKWTDFNFGSELESKRSQEVYA